MRDCTQVQPYKILILNKDEKKKINDVNSLNNQMDNIKEMITYFKDKNNKSKKKCKKIKTITTILRSFDTLVNFVTKSCSITLSVKGTGLIMIPISLALPCALSISNKVLYEVIINEYIEYKEQYERDQQAIKSFDKLYRKPLQENVIDKNEYESLCNFFTTYVDENKNECLL